MISGNQRFRNIDNLLLILIKISATPAGRQRRQLGEPLDQGVTPTAAFFVVTNDNRTIMAGGYWDNSFKCFSTDSGKSGRLDIFIFHKFRALYTLGTFPHSCLFSRQTYTMCVRALGCGHVLGILSARGSGRR